MENYVRRSGKKLIVAADDFGLARGVNEAIVRAYREGIVTSASLMVNGLAFESAVSLAKENPGLDIGLHLNLTDEPIGFAAESFRGKIRDTDLEREIRAQIEKALNAGVPLTHIDGHKHVHVIPQVLCAVCRVAPEYGIRAVRSIVARTPGLAGLVKRNARASGQVLKQFLFGKMATAMWKLSGIRNTPPKTGGLLERSEGGVVPKPRGFASVPLSGFIVCDRFYGIAQTGFLDFSGVADIIRHLGQGVNELMCHPGYIDDELKATPTRLLTQRERELELLMRPEVRDLVERSIVELISYRDLVEDYGSCSADAVLRRHSAL